MKLRLDILRRKNSDSEPYIQSIMFETDNENATVAFALTNICSGENVTDVEGKPVSPIVWEHSCLQKKCGACAMVIGSRPRLACDARLAEFAAEGFVRIEPLKKFPVVADLMVDRSAVFDALKTLGVWANGEVGAPDRTDETAYEASRCLQCGCCLEVCPNFYAGGDFFGMAAAVPASRLIDQLDPEQRKELSAGYRKKVYNGCGKSLACRDICPAHIDIEKLMSASNSAAVWSRLHALFGRKNRGVKK